jgi:hypothetical protein
MPETKFDGYQCVTCTHIFCGMSERYWIELKQPLPDPCPNYRKRIENALDLDEYKRKPKLEEPGDGRGDPFLVFCPAHCPCGYACDEMVGDDFKVKHNAFRPRLIKVI